MRPARTILIMQLSNSRVYHTNNTDGTQIGTHLYMLFRHVPIHIPLYFRQLAQQLFSLVSINFVIYNKYIY